MIRRNETTFLNEWNVSNFFEDDNVDSHVVVVFYVAVVVVVVPADDTVAVDADVS